MAVAAIDVSKESAESLEGGGPSGRAAWRRQHLLRLVTGIAGFIGLIVAIGFAFFYWSSLKAVWLAAAGKESWLLIMFGVVLPLLGGLGALFWALLAARELRQGLPKAPTTPEQMIFLFLMHCLVGKGLSTRPTVEAESYLLLLDGAKQEVQSFENFKKYWTGVRANLLHDVCKRLLVKQVDFIRCWAHEAKPAGEGAAVLSGRAQDGKTCDVSSSQITQTPLPQDPRVLPERSLSENVSYRSNEATVFAKQGQDLLIYEVLIQVRG